MHTLTPEGYTTLCQWEGRRLYVYLDSGGAPTIGIGHLLTRAERRSGKLCIDGATVHYHHGLTIPQCDILLEEDLGPIFQAVDDHVDVPLTPHQRDALILFTFNVGMAAFAGSTLLRLLNQEDYAAVPTQLRRWVYDNGVVVQGLRNRREAEIALWIQDQSA